MSRRMAYAAMVFLVSGGLARALQPEVGPAPEPPTIQSVQERRAALPDTQDAERKQYDEAIARLERAALSLEAASKFREEAATAPAQLDAIREELLRPPVRPEPVVPEGATLVQLEQSEADAIAALTAARDLESRLQAETTKRQERRTQIQEAIPQRRKDLSRAVEALRAMPADDPGSVMVDARRTALLAEQHEHTVKIEELEAERLSYDARRDLLPARRDLASRKVSETELLVTAWRQIVSARRTQEAARSAREAERLRNQAARQDPVLQAYAAETQRLAEQRTGPEGIPQKITHASQRAAAARTAFAELRQRYSTVMQRIEVSGLDRATGLMLRREFESIPDLSALRQRVSTLQRELEQIEYTLFERRDARVGSDDISSIREALLSGVTDGSGREAGPELEAVATELATARRDVLAELENDADRYQDVLVELVRETERLYEAATQYESFIRERILWVRSIAGDRFDAVGDLGPSAARMLDAASWRSALERTRTDLTQGYASASISVAILAILFALGRWSKKRILQISGLVGRFRTDGFTHTLRVVGYTACVSLPLPALLWWIGWILERPDDQVQVASSLGFGLQAGALLLLPLSVLRHMIRPSGLADAHFRWPSASLKFVRRHLRTFVPIMVPAMVLVVMIEDTGDEEAVASLGRVLFTAAMLSVALFIQRVLRPRGPMVREWLRGREGGWTHRLRYAWYTLLIAVPIALALVGWMGYFYTTLQLERRVEGTVGLVLLLVLLNGLLARWLFLARRQIAVDDATRRREQAVAAEIQGHALDEVAPTESSVPPIDEDKLDLPGISLQTRQLFRTALWVSAIVGLFAIWADVMPALRMLDRVEVYPSQRIIETGSQSTVPILEAGEASKDPGGPGDARVTNGKSPSDPISMIPGVGQSPGPSDADADAGEDAAPVSITLADIGLAIIVLATTIVAFRNLPGLVEILILQRLPLDSGSRFALGTVLRYSIAMIGIAAAFGAVDISWSNVQWLAAALTFGLAFGLQEIFANFISGLIILAERPIRIGDTVTVGSVTGNVTRIRMRATTITDWDRKELVIPNKTFITGDVINWTLSDPILRLSLPVGVSYGADVRKAERVLLEVASSSPNVLKEPRPFVLFGRFGDSTLDFELRVFIPHVDHIVTVKHDLHMRITERFREEGLEIAFPQRDLHVRSIGDLRGLFPATDAGDTPNREV